nr:MAG TPA: penicillin-binding protein-related factor A [Caudoviricetes sp.]
MIRDNQIKSLQEAGKHNLVAGFLCNFRNENNDTFFIEIVDFVKMMENIDKKSFNINDLLNNNAIRIDSKKKRTRYTYDIQKFVNESHL